MGSAEAKTSTYRMQMGHLRGMSVHVTPAPGEMSKGSWLDTNVFTDIAFETGCGLLQLEERHVFVTSISGAVYQVSAPCLHRSFGCLALVTSALFERSQRHALAEASLEKVYLVSLPSRSQCFENIDASTVLFAQKGCKLVILP